MQISFPSVPVPDQSNQKQGYDNKNRLATMALFQPPVFGDVSQQQQPNQRQFAFTFPQGQTSTPLLIQAPNSLVSTPPPPQQVAPKIVPPASLQRQLPPQLAGKQGLQIPLQQTALMQHNSATLLIPPPPQTQQGPPQTYLATAVKKQDMLPRKAKKERAAIDLIGQKQQNHHHQQQRQPQMMQPQMQPQMPMQTEQAGVSELMMAITPNPPFDFRSMATPGCFNIVRRGNIPSISFDLQYEIDCK